MKTNNEYWEKRFEALADTEYRKAEKYCIRLEEMFNKSTVKLEKELETWYMRLANNNEISYAASKSFLKSNEVEEFRWSLDEYIEYGKANGFNQKYMKQLENASAKVHITRLESIQLHMRQETERLYKEYNNMTTEHLESIYSDAYYRTAYEMSKASGTLLMAGTIDVAQLEKVMTHPWAQDGMAFSSRIWKNKDDLLRMLNEELNTQLIVGIEPEKAVKTIAERMRVSKQQARRLVMTETAAIMTRAESDSMKSIGCEEYEIITALDTKTCTICGRLDGRVFSMTQFKVGTTAPPFHCNCRCCTAPSSDDIDGLLSDGTRVARTITEKNIEVPGDMTYKEWKEKYIDNSWEGAIIKAKKQLEIKGKVNLSPNQIDLRDFSFDMKHIIARRHNVTKDEAVSFIRNAKVTITRWNGRFINYYSKDGAAYVDMVKKQIRTAYKADEYDEKIRKFMEVVMNGKQ